MLGYRNLQLQRRGITDNCTERPMCLSVASAARMIGCKATEKRHCLGGFQTGWTRR